MIRPHFLPPLAASAVAALLYLACPGSSPALDFTVFHQPAQAEGMRVEAAYITDGQSKIFLQIPQDWTANGGGRVLNLDPQRTQCTVRLEQLPLKTLAFDEGSRTALRKQAQDLLPSGARNVKPLLEVTDLLPIYGWTSLELNCQYDFFGQTLQQSVLFLNMNNGRVLRGVVSTPVKDHDDVHEGLRQMLSSWLEPSKDLPPELARQYEGPHGGT